MCGSTFHITSPLTLLILIKTKQNKTYYLNMSERDDELSFASKVNDQTNSTYFCTFIRNSIIDRDNNFIYLLI